MLFRSVPVLAVVRKLHVLPPRLVGRAIYGHPVIVFRRPHGQFVVAAARECLGKECKRPHGLPAFAVETRQEREVKPFRCRLGGVRPSLDAALVSLLHAHYAHGVDALVHADGVLPVVGTLRIFRVILYPHLLRSVHVEEYRK